MEGLEARDAWSLGLLSRNVRSETSEENDIVLVVPRSKLSSKKWCSLVGPPLSVDNGWCAQCDQGIEVVASFSIPIKVRAWTIA